MNLKLVLIACCFALGGCDVARSVVAEDRALGGKACKAVVLEDEQKVYSVCALLNKRAMQKRGW